MSFCPLGCQAPVFVVTSGQSVCPHGSPLSSTNVQVAAHVWKSMHEHECDGLSVHTIEFVQGAQVTIHICVNLPAPLWSPASSVGTAQIPGWCSTAGVSPGATSQPHRHDLSSSSIVLPHGAAEWDPHPRASCHWGLMGASPTAWLAQLKLVPCLIQPMSESSGEHRAPICNSGLKKLIWRQV